MLKKTLTWSVLAVAVLVIAGCTTSAAAPEVVVDDTVALERPEEPAGDTFRADDAAHVAATGRPQLVEFFAFWCTTCARVRPIVHDLEAEYWGEIDFVYLDIDDPANEAMMDRYGYTAQPFFVLIDEEGNPLETWFGYQTADQFRPAFDEVLDS